MLHTKGDGYRWTMQKTAIAYHITLSNLEP
jgi:hypothetical protein